MSTAYVPMTAPQPRKDAGEGSVEQVRSWWHRLPRAVRAPSWLGALAALIIVCQLLAFHQIVTQAVRKGAALRTAYPVAISPATALAEAPVNTAVVNTTLALAKTDRVNVRTLTNIKTVSYASSR